MTSNSSTKSGANRLRPRTVRWLILAPWILFLPMLLLYNPLLLRMLTQDGEISPYRLWRIGLFQKVFFFGGVFAVMLGYLSRRIPWDAWLMHRPRIMKSIFCASFLVAVLLFLEAWVGIKTTGGGISIADPVREFRNRESITWKTDIGTMRFSSRGTRGADFEDVPRDGVERIVVMGDSVTFGWGVEEDETISFHLAQALGSDSHEVINAGVSSYTFNHYYYQVSDVLSYRPYRVILGVCLNDLGLVSAVRLRNADSAEHCVPQLPTSWNVFRWTVETHSGLFNLGRLIKRPDVRNTARWSNKLMFEMLDNRALLEQRAALSRCWLRATAEEFRRNNVEFSVVIYPFRFQFEPEAIAERPEHRELQRVLMDACIEHQIPALDLYEAFAKDVASPGGDPNALFIDYDHFTSRGARVAADAIAVWLDTIQ